MALPPHPTGGIRQIQDEVGLVNAATVIRKSLNVEGFLAYTFECQEKGQTISIKRGRGTPEWPKQEIANYSNLNISSHPAGRSH